MITLANFSMNKRLMKTTFISSFVLFIASCSQTNPAQIKDVSDSPELVSKASSDTFSEESTDYTVPPKNISSLDSTETFTSSTTTSSNGDIVQTSQERFYYQRNYDDIPKGGYQGNTYTVKRGDTLFYIAWITGNDYRSLAAKNQIPEPYELKVGQVLDVSGNGTTVVVTRRTVIQSKQNNKLKQKQLKQIALIKLINQSLLTHQNLLFGNGQLKVRLLSDSLMLLKGLILQVR